MTCAEALEIVESLNDATPCDTDFGFGALRAVCCAICADAYPIVPGSSLLVERVYPYSLFCAGVWELMQENARCDVAIVTPASANIVNSLAECQLEAVSQAHDFVSYRVEDRQCFTSSDCTVSSGTTEDQEWVVYVNIQGFVIIS